MSLAVQWYRIEAALPEDWLRGDFRLSVEDPGRSDRAAALLAPLNPHRSEGELLFSVTRASGLGADGARRLLEGLDAERIAGALEIRSVLTAAEYDSTAEPGLADAWDAQVARLPEDWSDLHCEVTIRSGDELDVAALLIAPLNPTRQKPEPSLRFRVAHRFGYGATTQMTRRCLARLDEERIPGDFRILRVLCDTRPVSTQGPVWYVDGKVV